MCFLYTGNYQCVAQSNARQIRQEGSAVFALWAQFCTFSTGDHRSAQARRLQCTQVNILQVLLFLSIDLIRCCKQTCNCFPFHSQQIQKKDPHPNIISGHIYYQRSYQSEFLCIYLPVAVAFFLISLATSLLPPLPFQSPKTKK